MSSEFICQVCTVTPAAAVGLAVSGFYLSNVCHVLRLVRLEHRAMAPALVWLCLVPVVGVAFAGWMIGAVARSLRRQFTALGEHHQGDDYGKTAGGAWVGCVIIAIGLCVFYRVCAARGGLKDFGDVAAWFFLFFGVLWLLTVVVSFVGHWYKMEQYRARLGRHFLESDSRTPEQSRTQEQLDYDDDMPPPAGG